MLEFMLNGNVKLCNMMVYTVMGIGTGIVRLENNDGRLVWYFSKNP